MKKLVTHLLSLYLIGLLAACAPKTEEEQLTATNEMIAPEGYITKTHLYIHWPAVYTEATQNDPGGKEIAPAIALKIPLEYLGQDLISFGNAEKIERRNVVKKGPVESMSILHHSIFTGGTVDRNYGYTNRGFIESVLIWLQPDAKPTDYTLSLPFKNEPPDIVRKKLEDSQNSYPVRINRNEYFVQPFNERKPNVSPYEKPPEFSCVVDLCIARFSIKGRGVEISGMGEGLDRLNVAQNIHENKNQSTPSSNGLPKWRAKVDPTQKLLNSFVLQEDTPEAKAILAAIKKTKPNPWYLLHQKTRVHSFINFFTTM